MKTKLISKILGVGVAASTVIALGGTFLSASPAAADTTEWSTINTPNWEDGVILPGNDILDYDISGDDGNTIYVVAEVERACVSYNPFLDNIDTSDIKGNLDNSYGFFKSTDGGVTWSDITQNVVDADNLIGLDSINFVAVAPDDEDWVAVTGYYNDSDSGTSDVVTVASKNGGDDFAYSGDMEDNDSDTLMATVYDTEVSPETDDIHVIAVVGINDSAQGTVFELNAGTWLTGSWNDTSYWDGWDGDADGNYTVYTGGIGSIAEIDGEFSPNFADDYTFVVIGVADNPDSGAGGDLPYIQTGDFDSQLWGEEGSLPDPVKIEDDGDEIWLEPSIWAEGIALPADYDGTDSGARVLFGYVNAYNSVTEKVIGCVFRLDNDDVSSQVSPSGDPLLASIAVSGDADTGKMMIGEYAQWDDNDSAMIEAEPCAGVRVWHTEELDICCPEWNLCCKCPSGTYVARVMYTPDGEKEYATTTSSDMGEYWDGEILPAPNNCKGWGAPGDETAFSVSLDDAESWNQLSLIDTDIDKLSDLVVCPDCSVMYFSTINDGAAPDYYCDEQFGSCVGCWAFGCDSVWRSFDNGDTWERIYHGDWTDSESSAEDPDVPDGNGNPGDLLLRLPCDVTEDCCDNTDPAAPGGTVYLGVQYTKNMYYSRDCGQCWTKAQNTKIEIQDFAVDTESTVYVIDDGGQVSKSTNYGRRWSDADDTGIDTGHMITVCCATDPSLVVIGGFNEDPVAWSDDEGDTWNQTDDVPVDGYVHVACATTCENIIYIAVDGTSDDDDLNLEGVSEGNGNLYRGDLTDGSWTDMDALDGVDYTGIAVGRSDGTLYASIDYLGINDNSDDENDFGDWTPCLRDFVVPECHTSDSETVCNYDYARSAVARNLDPCSTACCDTEDWDYLINGLDDIGECTGEDFDAQVNALDICGCLTSATNTILYAIDSKEYDVRDGSQGTIWIYEDCASKTGPTLVSPADGTVLDCMACEGCGAKPFTLKWDRMCNACSYDVEIMDEDGNVVITLTDIKLTGSTPTYYFNPSADDDLYGELVCGSTYQWHVREANTTDECIHSQWSTTWTFTIATSSLNGVSLISPEMAANDVGTSNIGFSWTSVPEATSYSFVLSPNANLSGALASQEISTTAYNFAGPLENEKTYYWQVKAWKDTTLLSTSNIGVFTIAPKPEEPTAPVVVQETPAPTINIPAAQQITPTWIYAIIGIGAALAVVVIVLIVRTRRP